MTASSAEPPDEDELALATTEVEDALIEGDRTVAVGTAGAALRYPVFRRVFFGALLSNIGSWMQSVILGAYVFEQTHSSTDVGLVSLAQLGPALLLAIPGGAIADRFDRRTVLIVVSAEQAIGAMAIAWIVHLPHTSVWPLLAAVLFMGIGQAVYAPTFSALVPNLVAPRDLPGAISLNSANMNLSRVIGPAIGGILFAHVAVSWVFVVNAVSYGFVIAAVWSVHLQRARVDISRGRLQRMVDGVRYARADRIVGRCLTTMMLFSFFCLPVAILMPVVAQTNLGVADRSSAYGFLYAAFGTVRFARNRRIRRASASRIRNSNPDGCEITSPFAGTRPARVNTSPPTVSISASRSSSRKISPNFSSNSATFMRASTSNVPSPRSNNIG